MKHVLFGTMVLILFAIGAGALVAPLLVKGGAIPFVNGIVGGAAMTSSILFAIPFRVKTALETVAPYLPLLRPKANG